MTTEGAITIQALGFNDSSEATVILLACILFVLMIQFVTRRN